MLGLGLMAAEHMNRLEQIEGAKMIAFCDVDRQRGERVAQERGGKAYTDFDAMLKSARIDALYVCLPPFAHEGQEIRAAERGIHLYVEKPIALSLSAAREVANAIRKAGVISSVGYQIRYCPHVSAARQLLRDRRIDLVHGRYVCNMKGWKGWWPAMSLSGGQVVEQATHTVDMMRYLAGEVRRVFALYALREVTDTPGWDIPDFSVAAMKFASGALGTLHASAAFPVTGDAGVRIVCEDIELDCTFTSLRAYMNNETREVRSPEDPILLANKAFIQSVAKGKPQGIRSSYADATKSLAVTLAANESAARGQPVELS